MEAPEAPDLCGRTLGEFYLIEVLGTGGHGVVYRAEQRPLGRASAVKVLRQRLRQNDVTRDRFKREVLLASQLDHPLRSSRLCFRNRKGGRSQLVRDGTG